MRSPRFCYADPIIAYFEEKCKCCLVESGGGLAVRYKIQDTKIQDMKPLVRTTVLYLVSCIGRACSARILYLFDKPKFENNRLVTNDMRGIHKEHQPWQWNPWRLMLFWWSIIDHRSARCHLPHIAKAYMPIFTSKELLRIFMHKYRKILNKCKNREFIFKLPKSTP